MEQDPKARRPPATETGGEPVAPAPTPDPFQRLTLFSYTVEGNAPLYRAVMRLFLEAKERYRIQFRPDQVVAELRRGDLRGELAEGSLERTTVDRATVERALDQLVAWGNLRRSHDTGRVATLEDFRRRHFLYQLTPAGEAAERALGEVIRALETSGSLQRVMLGAILRNLDEVLRQLGSDAPEPERLYEALFNVSEQFKALTENASTFLARLHEAIDQGEVHVEAFRLYKQAVLEYLDSFLDGLKEIAPRIRRRIEEVEARGVDGMVALAARAEEAPEPLGIAGPEEELRNRWRGMSAWFVGEAGGAPTLERLREAARSAIHRILRVLERLHEKRFRRASRAADLVRLAEAFEWLESSPAGVAAEGEGEEAGDGRREEVAHRLFQAAFGLFGARHLGELHEDPDLAPAGESWWRAPPVPVAAALRETGRNASGGRPARIADHSEAKRFLAERHRRERQTRALALTRFADRGPLDLARLSELSMEELRLLLELLDRLLSTGAGPEGVREARSRDGRLQLRLDPPLEPGAEARVASPAGHLTMPAWTLTVRDLTAGRSAREAAG